MKLVFGFYLLAAVLLCGCSSSSDEQSTGSYTDARQIPADAKTKSNATPEPKANEWIGVYSSPSEISGFTGTVILIEEGLHDDLNYRKTFYSDVSSRNSIEQDMCRGSCLTEGNRIYIPEAYGFYRDGKPKLLSSVDRYTKVVVNGHVTLMRDDAYNSFLTESKLYDYGILIKVPANADPFLDFEKVEHKSIKILYDDKTKKWNDPFVSGANER